MGIYLSHNYTENIKGIKLLQKCAFLNTEGKILAVKRSKKDTSRPEKWDLPGGNLDLEDIEKWKKNSGRGDEEDILIKALKRELEEETGIVPVAETIKPVLTASGFKEKWQMLVIAIGYQCLTKTTSINLSFEHDVYKWVTKEEFLKMDVGDDGGFIYGIISRL